MSEVERVAADLMIKAVGERNELSHQLAAARYYVHKLRRKMYGEAVARGEMCAEEAQHHYEHSMANYDDVMHAAKNGSLTEANARQMAEDNERGF